MILENTTLLAQIESGKLYNDLMNAAPVICWIFLGMGILFIIIALPLALKKIGPNNWYGFRTKKAMSSLDAWYALNSITGKGIAIVGIVQIIINIISIYFVHAQQWTPELSIALLISNIVITDGGLIATIVIAFLKQDQFTNGKDDWA
ncbi:MAG: SdpI family protein [Sedimentisphaeraceae bacterium JB056]